MVIRLRVEKLLTVVAYEERALETHVLTLKGSPTTPCNTVCNAPPEVTLTRNHP